MPSSTELVVSCAQQRRSTAASSATAPSAAAKNAHALFAAWCRNDPLAERLDLNKGLVERYFLRIGDVAVRRTLIGLRRAHLHAECVLHRAIAADAGLHFLHHLGHRYVSRVSGVVILAGPEGGKYVGDRSGIHVAVHADCAHAVLERVWQIIFGA